MVIQSTTLLIEHASTLVTYIFDQLNQTSSKTQSDDSKMIFLSPPSDTSSNDFLSLSVDSDDTLILPTPLEDGSCDCLSSADVAILKEALPPCCTEVRAVYCYF